MKGRLAILLLAGAGCACAQSANFIWDYNGPGYNANSTWHFDGNGDTTFQSSSGGARIWTPAISGSNANDYEMNTTLAIYSGGGTYMHFLRASPTTVTAGNGSYISVELAVPSAWVSGGAVPLVVNQCVSGTVTQLAGTSVALHNRDTLRSVVWGTTLWVFINNIQYGTYTIPQTYGQPGYGGHGLPGDGSGFATGTGMAVKVGHHDTAAPETVLRTTVATSLLPASASLKWQGVADDPAGIGVFEYYVYRNDISTTVPIGTIFEPEFADATVQPSTGYTYSVAAIDYHGNIGAPATIALTTPPAGAADPRRTGLYSTGSYWGGGGEQIDTLSGNLHFSVPLLTAQARLGQKIPVNLVYDSQNWRQDNGVNWQLGTDVGYGFGWKMLIGSITPYYISLWSGVDHYVYTDGTGAQYRLDRNNSGVWTSPAQSVYVWLDTTASPNKLHFSNGTFWVMGSTSGGLEQDAGTMYPTIIEDTFGNQVIVTYDTAAGLPYYHGTQYPFSTDVNEANTSSRILGIDDVRGYSCYPNNGGTGCLTTVYGGAFNASTNFQNATYFFTYDHADYAIPHLTSFTNFVQTKESGTFTYTAGPQEPPFGTDPNYSGATAIFLSSLDTPTLQPYQFAYDASPGGQPGAGELTSVIFPFGGEISWNYDSFQYIGTRTLREVSARFLAPDSAHATSPPWSYGISRPDAANSVTVHSGMTLTDASGIGAKTWTFNTGGGPAWQIGLATRYTQLTAVGGAILQDDYYTWSQDPAGRPYISSKTSITDEGTGNQQNALSTQTLDQYGNVTQSAIYPYNNTSTPLQTWNNTYINSSQYLSYYVFNLLSTSKITAGGTTTTLASNAYDVPEWYNTVYTSYSNGSGPPTSEYDSNSPVPVGSKSALTGTTNNVKTTVYLYYPHGGLAGTTGSDGAVATASASSGTNYAAPQSISVQDYNVGISYSSSLSVTGESGQNGESLTMAYDSYGRPLSATSPYGAVTTYVYSTTLPYTQTKTGPDGVTVTTMDGFGRPVLVSRGDMSGVHSYTATVYAPCACSPLGKQSQVSQPYPSGSASAWTTWSYDGLGRTLSVQQPDGASTTTYAYSGNQTTVTDPAGKWKQFTGDVAGNLTTVVEPDPANQPGGTLTTTYIYDWMNHVTQVTMPRGSTTQTRTFVYDTAGRLTSATNPENGTVTYGYYSDNTLYSRQDAKGQVILYTYDSLKRLIELRRLPNGFSGAEDVCGRVMYTYDTNPVNPSFSQYSWGRMTTATYYFGASGICSFMGSPMVDSYTEMYSYHRAGGVTAKNVQFTRQYGGGQGSGTASLEVDYTYDTAGRTATVAYPMIFNSDGTGLPPALTLTSAYDTMGRPSSLNGAVTAGTQYDYAGRMTSLNYNSGASQIFPYGTSGQESATYNVNGQPASLSGYFSGPPTSYVSGGIQYVYSATQNNGQITQAVDTISGETINYQYDALKRLTSAASTPISGSTPTAWTQTYQYDGFGNLTAKVLNGTTTAMPVNAATNQLSNAYYDANGNMTSGAGSTLYYDEANRLLATQALGGGAAYYGYDPANKRVVSGGTFTFYGAKGEKLGTYGILPPSSCGLPCVGSFVPLTTSAWFAGRLILDSSNGVFQDRVGTNRVNGARFMPFGDEITSTSNDREKFGTYTRDSYTGLDYADQRFYASTYGRFNTPDPSNAGALGNPQSLNLYSYVLGDPVNHYDPQGLCSVVAGGIAQSAYSDATSGQQEFANEVGAVSVFSFSNGTIASGLGNLLVQGPGIPTGATANMLNAIGLAAQNPGPISLYLYSGAAATFGNAWNYLTPATQARIQNITYIDPASFGTPLPTGVKGTNVSLYTDLSDRTNTALQIFGTQPTNIANTVDTSPCGHNANCVYNGFAAQLSQTATNCDIGAGAVFGLPQRSIISGAGVYWYLPDPAPVPSVTEKITYDLP